MAGGWLRAGLGWRDILFDSSPKVIRLVVMTYVRYRLSLRNVEDLLHDVCINGEMRHLWRAVDPEGGVLESFVTRERDDPRHQMRTRSAGAR